MLRLEKFSEPNTIHPHGFQSLGCSPRVFSNLNNSMETPKPIPDPVPIPGIPHVPRGRGTLPELRFVPQKFHPHLSPPGDRECRIQGFIQHLFQGKSNPSGSTRAVYGILWNLWETDPDPGTDPKPGFALNPGFLQDLSHPSPRTSFRALGSLGIASQESWDSI